MKTTLSIHGKDTEVELTEKQVQQIIRASQNVTDRIKTFEDACEDQGLDPVKVLRYDKETTDAEEINENAYIMLKTIIKSLNGDWKADWSDGNQKKYYPWLKSLGSGLGLSFIDCGYILSYSFVGFLLVYRSSELAKYAGTQFIELYAEIMIIKD